MKIAIPTADGKLCPHFGHCEAFTFAEIDEVTKEIKTIEQKIPEEGISCQSAAWIAEQGAQIVLAGGMGGRPLQMFANCGVEVITGCPEEKCRTADTGGGRLREYKEKIQEFRGVLWNSFCGSRKQGRTGQSHRDGTAVDYRGDGKRLCGKTENAGGRKYKRI